MDAKRLIDPPAIRDDPGSREDIVGPLLAWYARHRRELPWRAPKGASADPYRVWLSEVMLQQTTVATVRPRFAAWTRRWPDFASLSRASEAEVMAAWAGLGYYARARNLLAAAKVIAAEHGGALPDTEAALRRLPGFGDYTAAAVAAIAFGRRAVVVDANVARVTARLFALSEPLPAGARAIRAAAAALFPDERSGDIAQALMDLGSAICTPRRPRCLLCPIASGCAALASGEPEAFPRRKPKRDRPHRYGTAFWLERDGCVLLVRRPAEGLLGGMRALPTGPWDDTPPGLEGAPAARSWRLTGSAVEHGFTHFTLTLALAVGTGAAHGAAGEWWPLAELDAAGLPTVFRRAAETLGREE